MSTENRARRRRIAIDPRLIIGVVLVVASIVGVMALVGAADARVTVYAAGAALSPGDRLAIEDLEERSVALDGAESVYLTASRVSGDELVVTRAVSEGELVPISAVGSTVGVRATALVVELSTPVSGTVTPGAIVDVWSAAAAGQGVFAPPTVLASGATVARVLGDEGLVAGTGGVSVEILVPRSRVARLLQAIANGDALAVVPAGLPLESR